VAAREQPHTPSSLCAVQDELALARMDKIKWALEREGADLLRLSLEMQLDALQGRMASTHRQHRVAAAAVTDLERRLEVAEAEAAIKIRGLQCILEESNEAYDLLLARFAGLGRRAFPPSIIISSLDHLAAAADLAGEAAVEQAGQASADVPVEVLTSASLSGDAPSTEPSSVPGPEDPTATKRPVSSPDASPTKKQELKRQRATTSAPASPRQQGRAREEGSGDAGLEEGEGEDEPAC
jgi:hypothetical protein